MPVIAPITRDERRLMQDERHLMQKAIHKTRDINHARRLTAMLRFSGTIELAMPPERFAAPVHPSALN